MRQWISLAVLVALLAILARLLLVARRIPRVARGPARRSL
jgi:hypothetical protein